MFKNVASQQIVLLAIDTATNTPKTGDAANITAYISKDYGTVTVLGDTTATEMDATNAPGLYKFDVTQTESNCDVAVFSGKSSTSGVRIVPVTVFMRPANATALSIDSSGRVDVGKIGGTSQTPVDAGARLDATVSSRMATYTQPTGFLAATFPTTVASTTNITAGTITTVTNLTNAPTNGDFTATMKTSITTAATAATPAVASVTGNVGGNVTGSVGSVVGSVTVGTNNDKTGYSLATAPPTAAAIATQVWTDLVSGSDFSTVGSAGKLLKDNIDAAVSSRLASGSYTAPPSAATISTQVQTDLGTGAALTSLASQSSVNTLAGYVDTEVAAIKAKTDNLPAQPAAVGDIPTAIQNANALLGLADGIETGLTPLQCFRLIVSATAGKVSGADGTTVTFRDIADTKDRMVVTVDASGNRTAFTRDLT